MEGGPASEQRCGAVHVSNMGFHTLTPHEQQHHVACQ